MKILIAGAGKVGKALTKELSGEGHDITLVDLRSDVLEDALEKYDVITYEGNSASKTSLVEAGIEDMDVFIAATNADEVNLLSCVTAKALNENVHCIARIRDPEYVEQAYSMRDTFHLSLVINPERQAAMEIARILKYPGFLKRETFAKAHVEIVELKLNEKSRLCDVQLSNLQDVTRAQVLICTVLRDGNAIMPGGDFVLKKGDRVFVTGDPEELHKLLQNIGIIETPVRHVLLGGGSRIAYYLAQELQKSGITASIIESDQKKCVELSKLLPECTIVHGDISDHSVLDSEDIGKYDAFVSLTGLDEVNIVASAYADLMGVRQIVTKIGRGSNSRLLDSLPIGSVISPKDLCTMHIVRYVRAIQQGEGAALTIHKIADGQAEAIEFTVDEETKHVGEPLRDVKIRKNILLNSIGHGVHTEIPNGDSSFNVGDTVVVVTDADTDVRELNDIFEA